MAGDLTTLDRVKLYLGLKDENTNSDLLLSRLVTAVSGAVLNYVGRATFGVQEFADVYDGSGKDFMLLRQWPVLSVSAVDCFGTTIRPSPDTTRWPPASGFVVESMESAGGGQQRLNLYGYCFPNGRSSVRVTYTAGYQTLDEPATVPTDAPYQVDPQLVWISDLGVTLADGTPLTKVSGSPGAMQYQLQGALYTFNAAQAGVDVLISYSSVPPDVDEATVEMVAEAFKRKDRLGIVSQSVGGQETVTYSQKDMSDVNKLALNPFRRVTPT